MPYLTQLAAVARRTGYPVTEVTGWKTRGHGPQPSVEGIVCHHTAGATGGGDYPSLGVVRDGRPGLDGPLSHFGLGRSGRIYVIAAGRCWHNAPSTSSHHTNSTSLGIEAENDGRQPWPAAQLDAYKRLCAELCKEFGLSASRVKGHKEVNTQKPDPHSVSMADFRADVARLMTGDDMPLTKDDAKLIAEAVWRRDEIPAPDGNAKNPTWWAQSHLTDQGKRLREIGAKLDAHTAALGELSKTLAALAADRGQQVDADALVARIEAAIERVTVRLDVQPDAESPTP